MSNLRVDELESLTTGRTVSVDSIDTGLREVFASPSPGEGSDLVAYAGTGETVTGALDRQQGEIDSVNEYVVPIPSEPISTRKLARNLELAAERPDTIKLCTFNIWGHAGSQNYGNGELANRDYLSAIKKTLLEIGAEYVGFQETYTTPTTNSSDYGIYPLVNSFFGLAHDFQHGRKYGNTSVSAREIIESSSTVYNEPPTEGSREYRGFTRVVVRVGTTPVAVYNTHLTFVKSSAENMIQELLTAVQSDAVTHIVIMGDFNVDYTFLSDFEAEGFTIANKDEFNTNNIGGSWYIDNILYKGFSSLVDKNTFDSAPQDAADHKPFYVELTV